MNEGRECEVAEAHVKASSKVDLRRKPPKIMKLWRFRYWGCIICTDWMRVDSIQTALSGLRDEVFGSRCISSSCQPSEGNGSRYRGSQVVEAKVRG